jgi:hypothetical protein
LQTHRPDNGKDLADVKPPPLGTCVCDGIGTGEK